MKRVLQTPTALVIENENQTYRHIFTDGRTLEASRIQHGMGYSVGRWDGATLGIDSVGFNDRTWLNNAGLPHAEDFRMPSDGGVKLLAVCESTSRIDPAAYVQPLSFVVDLLLAADTEMIEAVCEVRNDQWAGSAAECRKSAISIAPDSVLRQNSVSSRFFMPRIRRNRVAVA